MRARRAIWTVSVSLVGLLLVLGLTGSALVTYGPLPQVWSHATLACSAVGAAAASLLCVARAHGVTES